MDQSLDQRPTQGSLELAHSRVKSWPRNAKNGTQGIEGAIKWDKVKFSIIWIVS